MSYAVLFVCTGNICRSPTAEGVFRHARNAAGLGGRVRIDSAGTHGYHVGDPPDPRAVAVARRHGIMMDDLRARQFTRRDFDDYDLILAMDDGHLAHIHRMAEPAHRARCRLFLDFHPGAGRRDVPDPYYGTDSDFAYVLELVRGGADGLMDYVRQQLAERSA